MLLNVTGAEVRIDDIQFWIRKSWRIKPLDTSTRVMVLQEMFWILTPLLKSPFLWWVSELFRKSSPINIKWWKPPCIHECVKGKMKKADSWKLLNFEYTLEHSRPQRPQSFSSGHRSWFLVLTKRNAASGDENDFRMTFLSYSVSGNSYM